MQVQRSVLAAVGVKGERSDSRSRQYDGFNLYVDECSRAALTAKADDCSISQVAMRLAAFGAILGLWSMKCACAKLQIEAITFSCGSRLVKSKGVHCTSVVAAVHDVKNEKRVIKNKDVFMV